MEWYWIVTILTIWYAIGFYTTIKIALLFGDFLVRDIVICFIGGIAGIALWISYIIVVPPNILSRFLNKVLIKEK